MKKKKIVKRNAATSKSATQAKFAKTGTTPKSGSLPDASIPKSVTTPPKLTPESIIGDALVADRVIPKTSPLEIAGKVDADTDVRLYGL